MHFKGTRVESLSEIKKRLGVLEDIEAIRQLKARYWRGCDRKNTEAVLTCFCDGAVDIDYGPIGRFDTREAFVEVFRTLGCPENIVDMHHGANPLIDACGGDEASGSWDLYFFTLDTDGRTLMQLAGRYEDRYRRTGDGWRIAATRFIPSARFGAAVGDDAALAATP